MKKLLMAVALFLSVSASLFAQQKDVFVSSGVAIHGYDPVAYFTESKPVMGKKEYAYTWKDATWNFSSKKNMEAFKADPEKYAPQFGGFCAYGASQGHKAPTSPDAWTVADGKLYLNYNTDVMAKWRKDQQHLIDQANTNWPSIKDKE